MLQADRINPLNVFHAFSNQTVPRMRMKFNKAAQNPVALNWFVFFHELCHGLVGLKIQPGVPDNLVGEVARQYYYAREETICDSYAAAQTLRMMGESAIPSLRVLADMRLSKLLLSGQKYFTSLAIGEILNTVEEQGMQYLHSMDRDDLHKYVLKVAAENYFSPQDFFVLYSIYAIVNDPDRAFSFRRKCFVGRKAMDEIVRPKSKASEGTYDQKIVNEFSRSCGIVKKNYSYKSFHEKVQDKMRQCFAP